MPDEKTTEQLHRIIQLLQSLESIGNQIVKLLTPAPDKDVRSFAVTVDPPIKQ
jgi:hypothetical protein